MATYAIGDLQGCLDPLKRLLDHIRFDPAADRLWFVGDLVNRGPQSLETLRFVRALGDRAISVLGNHDLFLLSCGYTDRHPRKKDTLRAILDAPDATELLDWLRHRPLLHHDPELEWTLVHAGLPREWDLSTALREAENVAQTLRGDDPGRFLDVMFDNEPSRWSERLAGDERLRYTVNALTRMRYCHPDGRLDLVEKRPPAEASEGLIPWFDLPDRRAADHAIVFGHWSSLGPATPRHNTWCIDQGCLWGNDLTALRLDDQAARVFAIACPGYRKIVRKPA